MMKSIVIYFSAETGKTRKVAEELAQKLGADIFEIKPEHPYTAADMKWMNPLARCNKEKLGKKDVPLRAKSRTGVNMTPFISVSRSGIMPPRMWSTRSARLTTGPERRSTFSRPRAAAASAGAAKSSSRT